MRTVEYMFKRDLKYRFLVRAKSIYIYIYFEAKICDETKKIAGRKECS